MPPRQSPLLAPLSDSSCPIPSGQCLVGSTSVYVVPSLGVGGKGSPASRFALAPCRHAVRSADTAPTSGLSGRASARRSLRHVFQLLQVVLRCRPQFGSGQRRDVLEQKIVRGAMGKTTVYRVDSLCNALHTALFASPLVILSSGGRDPCRMGRPRHPVGRQSQEKISKIGRGRFRNVESGVRRVGHATALLSSVTSMPSWNFTPSITLPS